MLSFSTRPCGARRARRHKQQGRRAARLHVLASRGTASCESAADSSTGAGALFAAHSQTVLTLVLTSAAPHAATPRHPLLTCVWGSTAATAVETKAWPTSCRATTFFSSPCIEGAREEGEVKQSAPQPILCTPSPIHVCTQPRHGTTTRKDVLRNRRISPPLQPSLAQPAWDARCSRPHQPAARCASSRCRPPTAGWRHRNLHSTRHLHGDKAQSNGQANE